MRVEHGVVEEVTALDQSLSFDRALAGTFGPPRPVDPRPELTGTYDLIYRQYRLMADFAAEKLKFADQNSSPIRA